MGLGPACQDGASRPVNRSGAACCDLALFTSLYWGEVRLMVGIQLGRTGSALKRRASARVPESATAASSRRGHVQSPAPAGRYARKPCGDAARWLRYAADFLGRPFGL